jgi:hypothetical protein
MPREIFTRSRFPRLLHERVGDPDLRFLRGRHFEQEFKIGRLRLNPDLGEVLASSGQKLHEGNLEARQ